MAMKGRKPRAVPPCLPRTPRAIMFGGVPTGVAIPPSDAAMPTISIRARGDSVDPAAASARTSPSAMGSIMAAVAVLLIHIEMPAVTRATATRSRTGDAATPGAARMARAMRRSRPCTRSASARRKEPRKRKITGSPKGAKASRAPATPRKTASAGPSSDVTGSGTGSPTQKIITSAITAARRWAPGARALGRARMTRKANGPSHSATRRRVASNVLPASRPGVRWSDMGAWILIASPGA
jgi:hypothetical protein